MDAITIYQVSITARCNEIDDNMCAFVSEKSLYSDFFPTEETAKAKAETLFNQCEINAYTIDINACVYPCTVTPSGTQYGKRIFNLYKEA
jgi:hypothetical protein